MKISIPAITSMAAPVRHCGGGEAIQDAEVHVLPRDLPFHKRLIFGWMKTVAGMRTLNIAAASEPIGTI